MDNVGAVGGPLLALGLVALIGVRGAILASGVFGLAAAGSIVYAIRHIERPADTERRPLRIEIRPLLKGRLGRLWIPIGAFELGNLATTLLILRATDLLTPTVGFDSATRTALLLYAAHNMAAAAVAIPGGNARSVGIPTNPYRGVRVWPRRVSAVRGDRCCCRHPCHCVHPRRRRHRPGRDSGERCGCEAAPIEMRGSAFGLLAATQSFGNLIASGVAGVLWTLVSPEAAFIFASRGYGGRGSGEP